jgi:hypothetical protein
MSKAMLDDVLIVRMTKAEREAVREAAAADGFQFESEWIRQSLRRVVEKVLRRA